jgi:hypothetical protein
MPQQDWFLLMGMGGLFILLGLAAIIWGRNEEKDYYDSISSRTDEREFLEHWPPRPQFGALKIGGLIAISIGLLMLLISSAFWLWG